MFNYNYIVFLTISAGIYALFSLGLNVQWGYAGLINFGHVAFMTIGAYTTVLLTAQGVPLVIAVIVGGLLAATLGLLIGLSTLRLREDYLAIVTIGVSEVIRLIALNEEWLTQGSFGVQRYPLPLGEFNPSLLSKIVMIALLTVVLGLGGWQLWRRARLKLRQLSKQGGKSRQKISTIIWAVIAGLFGLWVYINGALALSNYSYKAGLMLVTLITLAVVYWGLEFLIHSPWGRVLKAIREDEEIPKALGKNVFWYKLQAFMLGGIIAGIAGAFFAWQLTTVYPSNFEPLITFYAWTIIVLGGAGNNAGTILGAIIFWAYFEGTRFLIPDDFAGGGNAGAIRIMIIGLILMVLMLWRPQGILGKEEELTLGR
jgi:neutral amino acid transport system permease protein